MSNPFQRDGEMLPVASINSVYVDDTTAYDLFRPSLILETLMQNNDVLQLDSVTPDASILALFEELLLHSNQQIRQKAHEIALWYGLKLAKVLSTLFRPSQKSIQNRTNWTSEHWAYWRTIRQIYLVGGLTSSALTSIFSKAIEQEFERNNITEVGVTFVIDSQNMGTRGLATQVTNGAYLLFDFGQTNIKRSYLQKEEGTTIVHTNLQSLPAKHLFYKAVSEEDIKHTAIQLNDYIMKVLLQTVRETAFQGDNMYLSIANYVYQGTIYSARGGYGKLAYLAPNYQIHLQTQISNQLGRPIEVKLFHDTSAMALLYQTEEHCAVISLGTAFGVAFPSKT